jgi:hypothetical protein
MHLFVAEDLVPGPQALEPGEQITTRVVPWHEAVAMCLDGTIDDAKTVAGILLVDALRRSAGTGDSRGTGPHVTRRVGGSGRAGTGRRPPSR